MKNVIHNKNEQPPMIAGMDQIDFQFAAILPTMGG